MLTFICYQFWLDKETFSNWSVPGLCLLGQKAQNLSCDHCFYCSSPCKFTAPPLPSLPHTHTHTSHLLTPADPSTPMCVTQGGDSQRWRCRHEGTQAISICLSALMLFLSSPSLSPSSSVAFTTSCYVAHWPMTWLVPDSRQTTFPILGQQWQRQDSVGLGKTSKYV